MTNKKQKCPICSTKLKMKNGRMTCKECGYYIREQSDPYASTSQSGGSGANTPSNPIIYSSSTPQHTPVSAPHTVNTTPPRYTSAPPKSASGKQKSRTNKSNSKSLGSIVTIAFISAALTIVLGVVGGILKTEFRSVSTTRFNSLSHLFSDRREPENSSQSTIRSEEHSQQPVPMNSEDEKPNYEITSVFFQSMTELIFNKPFRSVTNEDLARITSLQIDCYDNTIYFQLDHSTKSNYLIFENSAGMKLSDLRCFPNLEYLYLRGKDLSVGDLDGLENLHSIYAGNSLSELADILPDPENIWELGLEKSYINDNLDGLTFFPNLQYLSVDYCDLEDISALEQFPDLRGLTLADCHHVTDFSPLMSLTNLEELSIQSNQLKTIDFIQIMPHLKLLAIEGSHITSLKALSNCPDLTVLYLMDNYRLEDFSPIGELTQLTDLTLYRASSSYPLPSFENMTNLQSLTVNHAGDLRSLSSAVSVTQLYLDSGNIRNLDALTALPNLNTLSLVYCTFAEESLESLTHIPLVYLSLEESFVYGNTAEVFGIPTLQTLVLDKFHTVIDFDEVPDNESLHRLSMNNYVVMTAPHSYEYVDLSDHDELFDHFPNLEVLYAQSIDLDSIDFVEKLPNLQYLDITNNNVTSLKPLESLDNFHTVWCGKNTILESVSVDSDILVLTSTTPK